MAEPRRLDRLTAQVLFMLWADFGWSQDIGVLAILDGTRLLDPGLGRRLEASHAGCSSRWQLGLVASGRRFSALVQEVRA